MRASGWMPRFSAALGAHQQRRRRAVVEARGVGRRDRAVLGEGGAQLLHRLHGGAVADVFVAVGHDVALAGLDRDGRRSRRRTCRPSARPRPCSGSDGELVLHIAGDLPLLGHVLGGLTHVVAVERVPQTVADHRVDIFHVAHLLALRAGRGMGAHRHVFLTAGDDDAASPSMMCWAPSATARRPEPQTWLMPQAALSFGRPALICA
jgi:hypothetical protein